MTRPAAQAGTKALDRAATLVRPGALSRAAAWSLAAALAVVPQPGAAQDSAAVGDSAAASGAPSGPAALAGRVVSASTGLPLDGAVVSLVGGRTGAVTDSTGAFRIPETRPGADTVQIRYIGYEESRAPIRLRGGATTRAVFLLSPTAVRVAELRVEIERATDSEVSGFDERRRMGFGYFMSREEIEEIDPLETTDLFRRIPGVDVSQDAMGRQAIFLHREGAFCRPTLYLDGRRLQRYTLDEIPPMALDAIEVYRRASEAPLRFPIGDCGAVVVWTRAGEP